ncbi:hypothetical protein BVC80_1101g58 [Macleaya cordata]|uniref:Transmembrane protein n=1 Tax=Macleaya cordata TaxID=56857 RepID=A0A200QCQ7_MACCD|nr:hypothetical protein BVC80_1101g58 [Macleaya cordata]
MPSYKMIKIVSMLLIFISIFFFHSSSSSGKIEVSGDRTSPIYSDLEMTKMMIRKLMVVDKTVSVMKDYDDGGHNTKHDKPKPPAGNGN